MRERGFRRAVADGWLRLLFFATRHARWVAWALRPLALWCTLAGARGQRRALMLNARRLLGESSILRERRRLARRVLGNAFDSVVEFGANRVLTEAELEARLHSVEGEAGYLEARVQSAGRGAILVTAHLGSFEAAMGLLRRHERSIHVVFKRDPFTVYERLRAEQHARLGVIEAPVDDGLATWVRLRDALGRDEVVLMQADRVMPGQPGVLVPFLGGHARLPTGPVRLARLTGAPVIPVFSIAVEDGAAARGAFRIEIHPAIWPSEMPEGDRGTGLGGAAGTIDPAMDAVARVLERTVRAHPEQWLALHPVLVEDEAAPAAD